MSVHRLPKHTVFFTKWDWKQLPCSWSVVNCNNYNLQCGFEFILPREKVKKLINLIRSWLGQDKSLQKSKEFSIVAVPGASWFFQVFFFSCQSSGKRAAEIFLHSQSVWTKYSIQYCLGTLFLLKELYCSKIDLTGKKFASRIKIYIDMLILNY